MENKEMRELKLNELKQISGGELAREVKNCLEDWMEQDYVNGATKEDTVGVYKKMGMDEEAEYVNEYWDRMVKRHKFFFPDDNRS